ncbi:hypothetical protein GCM10007967_23500 [Xylanimonas ulmi]
MGVVLASTNALLFALMSLAQWAGWGGWYTASQLTGAATLAQALGVTGVNLGYGLLVVAGTFALRPMSWPPRTRYLIIAAVALVASLPRVAGLRAIYSTPSGAVFAIAEWVAGFAAGFVAVSAGVLTAQLVTRARDEETRRLREARRAARAVEELQTEEMRVRRMVSDQLHGTLQHRLVAVTAGLDGLAARLATTDEAAAAELREWAERLEEVRDQEVRSLSHAVFPSGVELGAHRAIEQMLRRLPVRLATSLEIGPEYRRLSDAGQEPLPLAERLVAVYTVEEAVTNALKHGRATQVRVAAEVRPADRSAPGGPWLLDVTVDDDGTGLPDGEPELFGLARHAERLQSRGGSLRLGPSPLGGARVRVSLPFDRTPGATEPGTPPAE